jgi:acyl carrier protein
MLTKAQRPTADDVLDIVREAVAIVLEVDPTRITRESSLAELQADSLALVEVAEIVEERLAPFAPALHISDAELDALRTIGDAVDCTLAHI